jgi:hypothetical protein
MEKHKPDKLSNHSLDFPATIAVIHAEHLAIDEDQSEFPL